MKTIIADSRTATDYQQLLAAIRTCPWQITEVISGCARGADSLGETWAESQKIPLMRYPADWNKFGRSAGAIRNIEMSRIAEALLALWDGKSAGTEHMINQMKRSGKSVHVHLI